MNPTLNGAQETPAQIAPQPSLLHPEESVTGAPIRFIGNVLFTKLAAENADGALSIMENNIAAHGGPPMHVHAFEEYFYILQGSFLFEIDGAVVHAGPGDFVHIPGSVPHVLQNTSDQDGKVLLIARPGGVERYFAALERQSVHDPRNVAAMHAIGEQFGIRIVGPPIAARGKPAQP